MIEGEGQRKYPGDLYFSDGRPGGFKDASRAEDGDLRRNDRQSCVQPTEHAEGRGWGATEASRGALQDWIKIKDGKIENYQVVTPTAWTIGPRDASGQMGPMEQAMVGAPILDPEDPVELGHVVRSYDSCLVCTVHAYDAKTNRELARFKVGGGC